jgi:hypothetical protein
MANGEAKTIPVETVAEAYVHLTVAIVSLETQVEAIYQCLEPMIEYLKHQDLVLTAAMETLERMARMNADLADRIRPRN